MTVDPFVEEMAAIIKGVDPVAAETEPEPEPEPETQSELDESVVLEEAVETFDDEQETVLAEDDTEPAEAETPVEAAPEPEPDLPPGPFFQFMDTTAVPVDQREAVENHVVELLQWEQALPPGAGELFDAVLSDSYVLVPKSEWEHVSTAKPSQPSASASPPSAASAEAGVQDGISDEYLDEALAERVGQLDSRLNDLTQKQQQVVDGQKKAAWRQSFEQGVEAATIEFAKKHNLSENEVGRLASELTQQQFTTFYNAALGDARQGALNAWEAHFWATPEWRQAEITRQVETERQAAADSRAKKRQVSSLSGSSSGTERKTEPDDNSTALLDSLDAAFAEISW